MPVSFGRRPALRLALWTLVIVAATIPTADFVPHTHWQKVQWVPFYSPPVKAFDIVINLLLYLPLGYQFIRTFHARGRGWHIVTAAAALSLTLEWTQLYSHARFPSMQDVVCNVAGAWAGARLAVRRTPG